MNETATTPKLTCPKCGANMRTYERNQIIIDQCEGCHGIFLDRGELERLISAENTYLASDPRAPEESRSGHHGGGGHGGGHGGGKGRKRRGFLGELFD